MAILFPVVVRSPSPQFVAVVVLEFHTVVVVPTGSSTGVRLVVSWKGAGTSSGAGLGLCWLDCRFGAGIGAGFPAGEGCKYTLWFVVVVVDEADCCSVVLLVVAVIKPSVDFHEAYLQ